MRATAAANPTTARRLSGASPENLSAGRRPTAEPAPTARKAEENAEILAPAPNRPCSPAKKRFGSLPASRASVKTGTFSARH